MKTRILTYVLTSLFCGLGLLSCNLKSNTLPDAQGKQGELLVVINKNLWTGACGDSIRQYLAYPAEGLPTMEPMYTLLQQDALSGYMQKFRNILLVNVDPGYESATVSAKTDAYARNQLMININAPSADSIIACVNRNKEMIVGQYLIKDRESYIALFKKIINEPVTKKIQEKFQVDICISKEYSLDVEKDDFLWAAREEGEMMMGVLLWKEPYTSKDQLDAQRLILKMNEMTKKYVPGSDPGSYMADEPQVPALVKKFMKDGHYCVQLNGLWQVENGFMGGPYVNLSMVDEKRGQIVTGVGFVFFPRKDKRQYVRQLEAILYTMTPAKEESQDKKDK